MMGTKKKIEVMQAAVEGKQIQCRRPIGSTVWMNTQSPSWSWTEYEYRIKPQEPKVIFVNMRNRDGGLGQPHRYESDAKMHREANWTTRKFIEVLDEGCNCE